ncbi:MAG TPA: hypothetical protein VGM39_04535 [Kofleriaceae bacterium]|jgi:hypothetical protein
MTVDNAPRVPEPRARDVDAPKKADADSDEKSVDATDDEHSDFSHDLKDAKDKPDGTRVAQEMLAMGTLVKPSPVRQATFVPPTPAGKASSSPLEAAVNSLLDQLHAITQRIGVVAQQALTTQAQATVASITAKVSVEDLDDSKDKNDKSTEKGSASEALPEGAFKLDAHMKPDVAQASKGPVATTAVREPAPLPEAPTSHMHLVVGEGDQRMVVTVAVRGDQVSTTIRGGDEQMQAALARNAASLDHALHTKGMDLSSFTQERDSADQHRNHHEAPEREEAQEQFRLEEILK